MQDCLWIVFQKWAPANVAYAFPNVWRDPQCAAIRARHDKQYAYFVATQNNFAQVVHCIPADWLLECLQRAIKYNHLDNVKLVVERLPKFDSLDTVCLSWANVEILKFLSKFINLKNVDVFSNVIHQGTLDAAQQLLECGNEIELDHVSDAMMNVRGSEMLQWVIDHLDWTAIDFQDQSNMLNETLYLMDNEPCRIIASHPAMDKNVINEGLVSASEMGHTEKVQILMHYGNPAFRNNFAIWTAASNEFWDIVELLLEDSAVNPWDSTFGPDIFCFAVDHDEMVLARQLLEHPMQAGQQARDIYENYQDNPEILSSFRGLISVKRLKR